LAAHGIATAIHYPVPVHLQPAYRHLAPLHSPSAANPLIETERAAAEVLSLPLYPHLPTEHLERVAAAIAQFDSATA
jgi:dTDP-4-amino-4,6-dideoxygalactose transaminase